MDDREDCTAGQTVLRNTMVAEFTRTGEAGVRDQILQGALEPAVRRAALDWIQTIERERLASSHEQQLKIVSCAKESAFAAADAAVLAERDAIEAKRMAAIAQIAAALAIIGTIIAILLG